MYFRFVWSLLKRFVNAHINDIRFQLRQKRTVFDLYRKIKYTYPCMLFVEQETEIKMDIKVSIKLSYCSTHVDTDTHTYSQTEAARKQATK